MATGGYSVNLTKRGYGYSIAAKRYALYEKTGKSNITIVDPKAHGIGFLYPPQDSPKNWDKDEPLWIYQLWDYIVRGSLKETNRTIAYNVVFPSQFAHLVIQYQRHPEAKSLSPDGTGCTAETHGLLQRAHVLAQEIRSIGKETDRKCEEGDEISVLEFAATEYGRKGRVVASEEVKAAIQRIGINRCARESGFHRANVIRKLVRGLPIKRVSYTEFVGWLRRYESTIAA